MSRCLPMNSHGMNDMNVEGHSIAVRLAKVKGFRKKEVIRWARTYRHELGDTHEFISFHAR